MPETSSNLSGYEPVSSFRCVRYREPIPAGSLTPQIEILEVGEDTNRLALFCIPCGIQFLYFINCHTPTELLNATYPTFSSGRRHSVN